jgi:hypothetical protein
MGTAPVVKTYVEFVENMADALPDITRPHSIDIHVSGWVIFSYLDAEGGVRWYPPHTVRYIEKTTEVAG